MISDNDFKRVWAEEICRLLQGEELSFVVAGGGARDTALGVDPKDFDIVVFGWGGDMQRVARRLDWLDSRLEDWAAEHELDYEYMPSYHDAEEGGDFGSRLYGVYKVGPVDIIISKCGCWSQVLNEFDFNLNQFYFPSSIPRYSGQYSRDPGDFMAYPYEPKLTAEDVQWYPALASLVESYDDLLTLRVCRPDASMSRLAYMLEKHEKLLPRIQEYVNRMPDHLGGTA
ncbi:hypothetical protein [Escherichia phage J8-65]|uniref:Uncharacterized protein n=1 Tax=Escherichia phage J8-65 TaxID=1536597 RepID=A0A088FAH4_9CAUD|nr:nucleotidyltransferase [Escherichia phage J8-65]AIM40519.1 hypothetical protein [Escherichia phage J8-65]